MFNKRPRCVILEIIRAYTDALAFHRMAHQLYKQKVPLIPRMIASSAHSKTGIDIHPGAQISAEISALIMGREW